MKRLLSVLLVAAMLMAVLPMAAVSAETAAPQPAAASVTYGDVNTDSNIDNKDLGLLQQYLSEWDVIVDETAADVNDDDTVNNKDLGLLQQYLSEWDVNLGPADTRPTIKILSIGHSFSRDAMDTYMADLFKAAGYNATFGYLYYPGASLERQYHYVKDDTVSYELYNKCVDGTWVKNGAAKASTAIQDEDWDIVTFQPSPDYGKGTMSYDCQWGCNRQIDNDYVHFNDLVNLVKKQLKNLGNEDVKFYWHLTWAFASDCRLWSFTYSNYNQTTMYWDFIKATGTHINTNPNIVGTIPCNTSIQNARTSWMGDTFNEPGEYNPNKDGYHLNDKGDLVAAMTWVAYFTGKSATEFKISTKYTDEQYAAFAEAVDNAIKKPLNITKSTYTTEP